MEYSIYYWSKENRMVSYKVIKIADYTNFMKFINFCKYFIAAKIIVYI